MTLWTNRLNEKEREGISERSAPRRESHDSPSLDPTSSFPGNPGAGLFYHSSRDNLVSGSKRSLQRREQPSGRFQQSGVGFGAHVILNERARQLSGEEGEGAQRGAPDFARLV